MIQILRIQAAAAVLLAGVTVVWAEPPAAGVSEQGLLLMRNGQTLQGRITREGDRFHVKLDSGQVWIKAVDIELHCRDLEEGYWLKRRSMPLGNVHGHLDLAQWCLQHELFGHAASELRDALAVEPQHPRIELLERRLKLAQQKTPLVKAEESLPDASPTSEDLDRMLRGLPPGAVETFTTSIQPLLINNCTAAGCHGPAAETTPRWVRVSAVRSSSRRLTQRNLHTTLQLVNREKPHESSLLVVPAQAHGSGKTAIFSDPQSSQYRMLVAWVQQVSQAPVAPQPATVAGQTPPLLQTMPTPVVQRVNFETPLPTTAEPSEEPPTDGGEAASPRVRVGPTRPPLREEPLRGEIPTGFRPKDPFDPAIFNRRFFPESKQ